MTSFKSKQLNTDKLGSLFASQSKRKVARPDHSYDTDLRALAGNHGRSMAGIPGRSMAGAPGRIMAGGHKDKKTLDQKISPAYNPVVRKLYYPTAISIRFPDNNKVPTINVNYANFATLKVGIDTCPTPYLIFLPAHNTGLFMHGGLFTAGGVTRFLPTATLPAARDLTNFTLARNLASRVGLRSGTISSTNVALSGTFNACSFYTIRDFLAFDVAEFSTRCITAQDYVQGVRSDNGIVLISGPEMVPDLRPIITTESYSDLNNLNINVSFTGIPAGGSNTVLYDYFTPAASNLGPLIHDRDITFEVESIILSNPAAGTSGNTWVYFSVEYSIIKIDGTKQTTTTIYARCVASVSVNNEMSLSARMVINPPAVFQGFITKIFVNINPFVTVSNSLVRISAVIPMQFAIGNLGPGFATACVGFIVGQEIVVDVCRSIEAVPSGTLLPDVKANMAGFVRTKKKMLELAIEGFNTPATAIRRVYTRADFYLFTTTAAGGSGRSENPDLSTFNSEDRIMSGPISGLIKTLTPVLSAIPGIGGLAGTLGSIAGGIADMTGFAGPAEGIPLASSVKIEETQEPMDSEGHPMGEVSEGTYVHVDGTVQLDYVCEDPELYTQLLVLDLAEEGGDLVMSGAGLHGFSADMADFGRHVITDFRIDYSNEYTPTAQLAMNEVKQTLANSLGAANTNNRYSLAMMGAAYLSDQIVAANVVGITRDGLASVETIYISDVPMVSMLSDGSYVDTTYTEVILSDASGKEILMASFSDDFKGAEEDAEIAAALYGVISALIFSGREKARGHQYVTLPRPGIVAGPSLGIASCVACLGIIDEHAVYSGGILLEQGEVKLTQIRGTFTKASEVVRSGMVLICSHEESIDALLDSQIARSDNTTSYPYVRASSMLTGIPVNHTKAIVADSILEAISVGYTINKSREILKTPARALEAKKTQAAITREEEAEYRDSVIAEGRVPIPQSLANCYGITTEPSLEDFLELPLEDDFKSCLVDMKENAAANTTILINRTLDLLEKGDIQKAFNGLRSLGDLLYKKLLREEGKTGGTQVKTGGISTLASFLAGYKRARPAAPAKVTPAKTVAAVNLRPAGQRSEMTTSYKPRFQRKETGVKTTQLKSKPTLVNPRAIPARPKTNAMETEQPTAAAPKTGLRSYIPGFR